VAKNKVISMLMAIVLLLSFTSIGSAQSKPSDKIVVEETILKAEPDSEQLKSVKLETFSDGSIKKTITGTVPANQGPVGYTIKVDKDKKTYKATKLDLSKDPEYTNSATEQNQVSMFSPLWSKQVKILTYDPVGWDIASTKAILYWYEDGGYSIYSAGGHGHWAANPSPINTHWYIDVDGSYEDSQPWRNAVGQTAFGSFSNYDFGDDDDWTYLDQDVSVWGFSNGSIEYTSSDYATGEGSLLLTSSVFVY